MSSTRTHRRVLSAVTLGLTTALTISACAETEDPTAGGNDPIKVGTTDVLTHLDPAGAYDNGSSQVMNQVYPFLMNTPFGSPDVAPDIAETAEFTGPKEFTVKLKPDLKFANGNDLTSSDVKFTFDRQKQINDPSGPASLLGNLESTAAPDELTVVFTLSKENDQTFPGVLSTVAGPIVDEDVFSATELTPSAQIAEAEPFAGQYTIKEFRENEIIQYVANPKYQGVLGEPKNDAVTAQYFAEETALKLAVEQGDVDVAYRSLSPTDIADLRSNDKVVVHDGPGGEIRYIVFNFNTQPFGAKTKNADAAKALAVRQAVAHLIDRDALSEQIYQGTYTPLYSYVPEGLTGANESLKGLYGDGQGGPDAAAAAKVLKDAGVPTPVTLDLQYSPDHYGKSSDEEYALIESQLETDELFDVQLNSTLWDTYSQERTQDLYPAYQLGWFPDFSDADNYLSPFFFSPDHFLGNHYDNPEANEAITKQATEPDEAARTAAIEAAQNVVAKDLSTIPYLQGASVAISTPEITGVADTLDASFKFRYGALGR